MIRFKNKYNLIFFGFILSIIFVFFSFRPLNSYWFRLIAGDGLGYYSYLPAKYIYHDSNYDFKWFNKVYTENYADCSFNSPDENFLVTYKDKKINKYYQGLSFIWFPFFAIAHVFAKISSYPTDGYSLPYQISIGFASLFYLFLGLWYLRKLLQKLFKNELISTLIPIIIFYGGYLFYYSIFANSQSHVYSFTFITLFIYFAHSFFNNSDKKLTNVLLCILMLVIIVCIRPLNVLIVLVIPALIPAHFFKEKIKWQIKPFHASIILLICMALINQFHILYTQTHSFIPYTYTNESFYFKHPKLFEVLFSYNAGLFIYVPMVGISLLGIFFLETTIQKIIFPILFFLIVYIYSSWWYWPITSRALIDYYPLIAILLAALLHKIIKQKLKKYSLITLLLIMCGYHQLKSMQLHSGILDEYYTHSELFWRNFLRIHKINQYVIPPESIIKEKVESENFETTSYAGYKTEIISHTGKYASLLDSDHPYSSLFDYNVPTLFKEEGVKKIRFSFWCYFKKDVSEAQLYFKFFDKQDSLLNETAYYINQDLMQYNTWDYKEFGYELNEADSHFKTKFDHLKIFIWNNQAKNSVYIDDVKTEFILTNNNYEVVTPLKK